MHSYIAYELYRERLAQIERDAEIRRQLPRRKRRGSRHSRVPAWFRRRAQPVVHTATHAQPCR